MDPAFVDHPDKVRYPIGDFGLDPEVTPAKRRRWIQQMDEMPGRLAGALAGLTDAQLSTPYREGGWSSRQVVHHLAVWAETADGREAPVELSLQLLAALHRRWTILLESLTEAQFARAFSHPQRGTLTIDKAIQLYAWHCLHHTAHVDAFRARQGW